MKKAFVVFLCFVIVLLPAAMALAGASGETGGDGIVNILVIVSTDKKMPGDGKTFGMGNYLITLDTKNNWVKFTSFPYNLAVTVQGNKGEETKQLQFVCQQLGPEGTQAVIEANFGIDIDYWLLTTMTGLADLVDAVGGIEVDLPDLSINKKAGDLKYMVDRPYVKVQAPGLQMLNGVQAMAYISDTYYDKPTLIVEEGRFRERHEVLINGIVAGLRGFRLDTESVLTLIFDGLAKNYSTNMPLASAFAAICAGLSACLENDPAYLHIPREIFTVDASNGWESLGFTQEDVQAVQDFVKN